MSDSRGSSVLTLGRAGRTWRLVAVALAMAALAYGTIRGTDDDFPAGPMVQFAFYVPPDGVISSVYVDADTTAGTRVHVHLSSAGVGLPRAEVEGQFARIVADPSLLQGIADAQRRLHPDQPQFTRLYLMQEITTLHDRRPGSHQIRTAAVWTVQAVRS